MTDIIEQKALALIKPGATCEVNLENISVLAIALTRAIERHEAFRQEVSDAAERIVVRPNGISLWAVCKDELFRFILPQPDPLVEALDEIGVCGPDRIYHFRTAIAKRGGKIVWGEG